MSNLSSSSSITPTPSTFHHTPTQTHPSSVYASSSPSGSLSGSGAQRAPPAPNASKLPTQVNSTPNHESQKRTPAPTTPLPPSPSPSSSSAAPNQSRIPVTPAVLRSIFASSRTAHEERSLSRVAFFRFTGFLLSCLVISLAAAKGRGIKSGAALLGVGVV